MTIQERSRREREGQLSLLTQMREVIMVAVTYLKPRQARGVKRQKIGTSKMMSKHSGGRPPSNPGEGKWWNRTANAGSVGQWAWKYSAGQVRA